MADPKRNTLSKFLFEFMSDSEITSHITQSQTSCCLRDKKNTSTEMTVHLLNRFMVTFAVLANCKKVGMLCPAKFLKQNLSPGHQEKNNMDWERMNVKFQTCVKVSTGSWEDMGGSQIASKKGISFRMTLPSAYSRFLDVLALRRSGVGGP